MNRWQWEAEAEENADELTDGAWDETLAYARRLAAEQRISYRKALTAMSAAPGAAAASLGLDAEHVLIVCEAELAS